MSPENTSEKETKMAYRYGDRSQLTMFPQSIEEYVGEDDPVRAYDAFVKALKMEELGIVIDETQMGNSEYDPEAMIKLLAEFFSLIDLKPSPNHYLKLGSPESLQPYNVCSDQVVLSLA